MGRPFIRQLKMVQDQDSNYIYLRQESAITWVNLKDHYYRDVAKTPFKDFESATTLQLSWIVSPNQLWMCGASDNVDNHPESEEEGKSEVYVLEPFLEKDFVPHGWNDILATLDVCINEVTPAMFCNEEGYDLFPF